MKPLTLLLVLASFFAGAYYAMHLEHQHWRTHATELEAGR